MRAIADFFHDDAPLASEPFLVVTRVRVRTTGTNSHIDHGLRYFGTEDSRFRR